MNKTAFAEQIVQMQDTLYRISYSMVPSRYDQEDAVQECIKTALAKLHTLREERYFRTWVIRILINECHSILRRRKREIPSEIIAQTLPADGDAEVVEALMALEVNVRLPILLHYVEGYSIREIARMLRVPENTIKTRMARGRKQARVILEEGGPRYA